MKHQHVIYNSSEKNRSGGVGFGVRSATAGIQPQLLSAMEQNGIFSFKDSNVALSPSALLENPDLIKQTPASYFFQVLQLTPQEKAYVLGRKIAVGFDYTFYLNGRPGRLGNYVVDSYVFNSCPEGEDFEILLERPAPESVSFIPIDPSPRADNEEMRGISVGHCPDLAPDDAPFRAMSAPSITPQAIDLLFAYLQSRKEGKPLLVKGDADSSAFLMAALAMMMPRDQIENITFVTNHNEQGRRPGINIFFINEHYRFEIFPNLWCILDLRGGGAVETEESSLFRGVVSDYAAAGNVEGIRRLVGWCLSDVYVKSKTYPRGTQRAIFTYVNDFPRFDVSLLASDAMLRQLLKGYLADRPSEALKLRGSLQRMLDNNPADVEGWLDFMLKIGSSRISDPVDVAEVLRANRNAVNDHVFRDSSTFLRFHRRFADHWDELMNSVLDGSRFAANEGFLYDFNGKQWAELYPYFLAHRKVDSKYFVQRLLDCRQTVSRPEREKLIVSEIPESKERASVLLTVIRENFEDNQIVEDLIPLTIDAARTLGIGAHDFFTTFPNQVKDPRFLPFYTFSLETARLDSATYVREFYKKLNVLLDTESGKMWLNGNEACATLRRLYAALKKSLYTRDISYKEALGICDRLCSIGLCREMHEDFGLLRILLQHETGIPPKYLKTVWKIAEELDDTVYLRKLVPEYLKVNSPEVISELVDKGYMTRTSALEYALGLDKGSKGFPYILVLLGRTGDAQEQLDFLVNDCGYTDEEAMSILEKYQPDSHKRILKIRKPSIWSKLTGMFRKQTGEEKEEEQQSKPAAPRVRPSEPDTAYRRQNNNHSGLVKRPSDPQKK